MVYRGAEGALRQIAGQWVERFRQIKGAKPEQEYIPPVLIVVCDNTEIAEVFYRRISGESEEDVVTETEVEEVMAEEAETERVEPPKQKAKRKKRTVYGQSAVLAEFSNGPEQRHTIRIDSKVLDEAEELRKLVATVGRRGEPGEYVRCVVSVSMLTEGWDANNVTHILGIRAFGSQLLCEQVVGRGLRRMDYVPEPATGLLTEEYVDVYGIPFSVIPFKGRPVEGAAPDDRQKNHVRSLPERRLLAMEFPIVEGYAFALTKNAIACDVEGMERLELEPNREPTATFVRATLGYQEGAASGQVGSTQFLSQDWSEYYRNTHLQTIEFAITKLIVQRLTDSTGSDKRARVLRLQSRHQLFPQAFRYVDEYVRRKVTWKGCNPCELGLETYVQRIVERLSSRIEPDSSEGEVPLMPVLNRYQETGSTADVDFKTVRACHATDKSQINQVVMDNDRWEGCAAFRLEDSGQVRSYARNDHLGLTIPYEYEGQDHAYEPDFLVRLGNGTTVVLEIKGYEDDQTRAKHDAAKRWVTAVNNWKRMGKWAFHVCRDPQVLGGELEWLASYSGKS